MHLNMFRLITLVAAMATALFAISSSAQIPSRAGDQPVPSLAPMIKKVAPAVVNISTTGTVEQSSGSNPFLDDPLFRRFFDFPERGRSRRFRSSGSGVIVDASKGYIITNHHVVEHADEINVTLKDERLLTAEVIGSDPGSDVALIRIDPDNLVEIALGNSDNTEVGDFVVAIGNPFGLQHTVTSGIVSALGRSGISPDGYEDFIQTDASINPGNSGGALVNLNGELVGINSAIISGSGGNIGIGFAIPVNMVKSVMEQLLEYGEVHRGLLGVNIYTLTPAIAKEFGVENTRGALVSEVSAGSAAAKAGIETGDIITSVNDESVTNAAELRNTIGLLRPGETVRITLMRDGTEKRFTAMLEERVLPQRIDAAEINPALEGAEFAAVDSNSPNFAGVTGVIVASVAQNSAAAQRGLRANDVITHVNRVRVENLDDFTTAMENAGAILFQVQRGNRGLLIPIQ